MLEYLNWEIIKIFPNICHLFMWPEIEIAEWVPRSEFPEFTPILVTNHVAYKQNAVELRTLF